MKYDLIYSILMAFLIVFRQSAVGYNNMKTLKFIVPFILLTACTDRQSKTANRKQQAQKDTVIKHDTIVYSNNDCNKASA